MDLSDHQLLERFISNNDEQSFEQLLRRHAPMVMGVCQRVIARLWAEKDPQAVTLWIQDHLQKLPRDEDIKSAIYFVASALAKTNPEPAASWLA